MSSRKKSIIVCQHTQSFSVLIELWILFHSILRSRVGVCKGLHSSRHWAYRKFEEYKRFLRGAQDITTSKRSLFNTRQTPEGLHTRMKNSWHINLFFTFSKWKLKFYLKENFICYAPVLTTHQHAQWHMKHIYSIEFDCTNLLAMGWKVLTIHILEERTY